MKNQDSLPEYEVLRVRSIADIQAAESLMSSELYDHAMEQCHFGLEKIMKAALIKHGVKPPQSGSDGHNLLKICNVKTGGRKILLGAIKSNSTMLQYWEKVHSRWDTDLRYGFMGLDPSDYDDLFEAYRGLTGWIRIKLVE
jgi:HEPN domain-containing protein